MYYQGKFHSTKNHKVIFTGNPETYPGRYHHQLLQQGARTLWMKSPQRDMVTTVMKAILNDFYESNLQLAVEVYFVVNQLRQFDYLSLRDAKSFAHRIKFFMSKSISGVTLCSIAMEAFYYGFAHHQQRESFKEALESYSQTEVFSMSDSTKPTRLTGGSGITLIIPRAHHLLLSTLNNTLKWFHDVDSFDIKRGLLLEGCSGIGKSSLLKYYLSQMKKPFIALYGGTPNVCSQLTRAFQEGQWVLLDEMNLEGYHEDIEKLLLHYLTGVDEKGQPPQKTGFTLLATQNPSSYEGRASFSLALLNRFHIIHMPEYNHDDLVEIADGMGIHEPSQFVKEKINQQNTNIRSWGTA